MKLAITNIVILVIIITTNIYSQTWTLKQCIDSAYENNTQIYIAKNNKKLTELKHQEVRTNLLPKLSLNGEYKYFIELPYQLMPLSVFGGPEGQFKEAQFGVPHNINANLVLQAPIYSPNLMGNIEKLKTAKSIVDVEISKTYDQIYFEITTIYRNAQLVKSQINFIDSIILNTEKVLKNSKLLVAEKMATSTDVKKLDLKISTLNLNKANLEANLQQLNNALKLLIGTDSAIEVEDNIEVANFNKYDVNGNKDIEVLLLQEEMTQIDLKTLKRTKYLPEVGLIATYGTQGFGYDQSPNPFLNFYPIGYVGLRVSYPLFNGTVTNKQINQKKIELESLKLKQKLVDDSRKTQISNALIKLENAFKNIQLNEKQLDLAQLIYEQEVMKNKEGLVSINDLLFAQNELIQYQQNYLQSIAQFLATDLELKNLTNNISNN